MRGYGLRLPQKPPHWRRPRALCSLLLGVSQNELVICRDSVQYVCLVTVVAKIIAH